MSRKLSRQVSWVHANMRNLFVGGQLADAEVAVVAGDTLVKLVFGEEVEELGEDGATFVYKVKKTWSCCRIEIEK